MTISFFKDRMGRWWYRVTPPWVTGYRRISTLYPLDGFTG